MAKERGKSTESIEALLEERQKVLQWLDRLNMADSETPAEVRDRVRSDYEGRLERVAEELTAYTEELQGTLARHQANHAELSGKEKESDARMAEAKLRHAVGEFPESKWNALHSEILGELVKIREELKTAEDEINRHEEVLNLIHARPVAEPAAASAPVSRAREVSPPPSPPRPEPVASVPKAAQKTGFDELAFIKSVTEDEAHGPAAAQATGQHPRIQDPIKPMRVSQEIPSIPEVPSGASGADYGPKKTLKCGECGVMNFPTEWYCERCGAELASI